MSRVVLMAAAIGCIGCAQEQEALVVAYSPVIGFDCVIDPSITLQRNQGTLDVGYTTGYLLPVILRNNLLTQTSSTNNSGIDNAELQLTDVDVHLSMPSRPEIIEDVMAQNPAFIDFTVPLASVSVPAQAEIGVGVDIVTEDAAQALRRALEDHAGPQARGILIADLVFHATRTGNSTGSVGIVDARSYRYPIELCIGCLPLSCETCADQVCPNDPEFVGICGNAQDSPLFPSVCEVPSG